MTAIWIDLDNSPHVPLFVPIIKHYRERGVKVILTARDHSQTIELLDLAGLHGTYFVIGRHYGKSKINKVRGLISRTFDLLFVREANIAVAVSHGSRSMVLTALGLNIPVLTMYDYEYTETRMFNMLSDRVLVPEAIPDSALDQIKLPKRKRVKYPGIKEELYVSRFHPTPNFRETFLSRHQVPNDKVFVILRPPATTATYHDARSEILLEAIINQLLASSQTFTLIVPRTREQESEIREKIASKPTITAPYAILHEAVDGLELIYAADLVISGGGTMNREAALLGVPVYSIFAGRQGALDRQMEADDLITFIRDANDLGKIHLKRRAAQRANPLTDRVESFVIGQIDEFLKAEQTEK